MPISRGCDVAAPVAVILAERSQSPPVLPPPDMARHRALLHCGIKSWPMSELGHFRPIRPVLPAGRCPLRPESGHSASIKLMLRLWRQLVGKLRPFLFDDCAHLVRNDADMFDFQHVLM